MFDLTREVKLNPAWEKRYQVLRILVVVLFISGAFYFSYKILFPSQDFIFSFITPDSKKNTLTDPRDPDGKPLLDGNIKGNNLVFDAPSMVSQGHFSQIKVKLALKDDSSPLKEGSIAVKKSYRAFLYPEGDPMTTECAAPENSLKYPSGTLLSYGISVYVTEGQDILPIANPRIFESMGYNWADVIPAGADDISAYAKGGLMTAGSSHPNGTIFAAIGSGEYYIIDKGGKRKLAGEIAIRSCLRNNPVLVDERALDIESGCQLKKSWNIFSRSSGCTIPIEKLNNIAGNDYQFEAEFGPEIELEQANATIKETVNWKNFIIALADIKNKIYARFQS
jgi:hypothetical protein